MEEKRNSCMVSMGRPEGKRPPRRLYVVGKILLKRILEIR
jgi:hypothetical protein